MRRQILFRSAAALLGKGERVRHLVYMFRARPSLYPLIIGAAIAGTVLAWAIGVAGWPSRVAVGVALSAMVMMLGVDYRVLVGTDDEIVMMHGGRLRQVATSVVGRVSSDVAIEPVGNNLVMTQWQIGDEHYSVMKRFQSDMVAIAQMSSD